jgi:hypothetical protein
MAYVLLNIMTTTNDDSICPLCQQVNSCDVNANNGCWCMNTNVPQALLAKIPTELKGVSCVCNACIDDYYQQHMPIHNAE